MSTAEDIQNEIAASKERVERIEETRRQAIVQVQAAQERQSLRRELDVLNESIDTKLKQVRSLQSYRNCVDNDLAGLHLPGENAKPKAQTLHSGSSGSSQLVQECAYSFDCGVRQASFTWRLSGFKWLRSTLKLEGDPWIESDSFEVAGEIFTLRYSPCGGPLEGEQNREGMRYGSLAILAESASEELRSVNFRYKFHIKHKRGEFVQWGQEGLVSIDGEDIATSYIFGPDVAIARTQRIGIFGLSYEDLLTSDWIDEDTLTIKVDMEAKNCDLSWEDLEPPKKKFKLTEELPASSLVADLLATLQNGIGCDVTFVVGEARHQAHAVILRARSKVFEGLLGGSFRETTSSEIVIEDCDPNTFQAFLRYLYTDDFEQIRHKPEPPHLRDAADVEETMSDSAWLQGLLAISHKYQVLRLQQWCEQQLSSRILCSDVCSVLCQAHLYEAKQLEDACLEFIKENFKEVVQTDGYGELSAKWAEVALKINIAIAGLPKADAKAAVDKHLSAMKGKSKRND
eukprot:TRINITY_DN21942_c0_g1_i1.p1 TRINITY_DN21942_c0_g1~~TRINITY_DN21942_c0_g1_i1.p1  ORF type:complete len:515 (+),score=118.28 TRINITY_DN21942_c0_g1_i1:95-1639(+)